MLVWSRTGRLGAWTLLAVLFGVIYVLPLAVIGLASFAGQ
jgi:2-aminoethylphosphonate transport system permease protein